MTSTATEAMLWPPRNTIAVYCRALAYRMLVDGATCPDLIMPDEPADLANNWRPHFEQVILPKIISCARANNFTWQYRQAKVSGEWPEICTYFTRVFQLNGFATRELPNGAGIVVEW